MSVLNFPEFDAAVRKEAKNLTGATLVAFHSKLVMDAARGIVMLTPVDTGRARGNWQPSIGTVLESSKMTFDKMGPSTIALFQQFVQTIKPFDVVYITNNVDYISYLEHGTDRVAAFGMVSTTVAKLTAMLNERAA